MNTAHTCTQQFELAQELVTILSQRNQSLATAESCTGGLISAAITAIPGSSAVFRGGIVAYDSAIKQSLLQVPSKMLEQHGPVSREVVREMAAGARRIFRSDWALAVTGIAGPGGGTESTPVGTVWMAIAGPEGIMSLENKFSGDRRQIQEAGVYTLLKALYGVFTQK